MSLRLRSPVSREQAAEARSVARSVAAFHLDKLADVGLLAVEFRRPPGRRGPGAGRPAKLYRAVGHEVAFSVPERHYDLAAAVLALAVADAERQSVPVAEKRCGPRRVRLGTCDWCGRDRRRG